jgi:hypothetical protein
MRDAEKPENSSDGSPEEIHAEPRPGGPHPPSFGECGGDEIQAVPGPEDWQESGELGLAEPSPHEMAIYGATVRRIEWMIGAAGAVCAVAVLWPLGWAAAVGVLLGTLMGWINFRWLAASVNAIGERIVKVKSQEHGAAVVARGVGRIFLIALFAYVIFTYSLRGLAGFLAGLAMPVIALMCEAMYEFVANVRRSS